MKSSNGKTEKGGWMGLVIFLLAEIAVALLFNIPWIILREKIAFADADVTAFSPVISSFYIGILLLGLIILWIVISLVRAGEHRKTKNSVTYAVPMKKSGRKLHGNSRARFNISGRRVIVIILVVAMLLPMLLGICWRKSLTCENSVKFYSPFGNCTAVYDPQDIEKVEIYARDPERWISILSAQRIRESVFGIKLTFTDGKTAKFEKYYFKGGMKDGMPDRMLDQMAEIKALVPSENFSSSGIEKISRALNGLNYEQRMKLYKLFSEEP